MTRKAATGRSANENECALIPITRQTTSQFGAHVTSVDVVERINACCTSLAAIWALSAPTAGVILLVSLMQLR